MKRLVGVCCTALALLLAAVPITGGTATAATGPAASATGSGPNAHPDRRLAISISEFTPRMATESTQSITVSGTVRNIGDRKIEDLEVRLQAGDPIRSPSRLHAQLTTPTDPQRHTSHFQRFSRALQPGGSTRFTATVPRADLAIDRPGVYPLQVNVNGKPDYGGMARLVALNLLLPMRSDGSGESSGESSSSTGSGGLGISMLWPLAGDHPRLAGTADNGETLLSDDGIAASLRKGGRLYGLVDAAKQELSGHPDLSSAMCFAIDPELLDTVNAMASGYLVRDGNGGTHAGTGKSAAAAWLAELRGVTDDRCVLALPYADSNLAALNRAGATDLVQRAVHSDVVTDILPHARKLPNVLWPADGTIDKPTLSGLTGAETTTVLADPYALTGRRSTGTPRKGTRALDGVAGAQTLPVEPTVSTALGGLSAHATGGQSGTLAPGLVPATNVAGVSTQNGLAALLYRASTGSSGPALITPPRRWHASEAALTAFLDGAVHLFETGAATPRGLHQLVSQPPGGSATTLRDPPRASAAEIPPAVTKKVIHDKAIASDMLDAMSKDNARKETPAKVMRPITFGLLRATSTAWRDLPDRRRRQVIDDVTASLHGIIAKVTVQNPGRPISLASDDSRIPVAVSNSLPVDVTVHISVQKAGGLQVESIPDPTIPAYGGRTLYIPTKVLRSGWLSVDVALSTPGGLQLGSPARLQLRSSAYGTITLVVTATAFGLLVLLAGRRLYRRARSAPGGRDGHTEPEQEVDSGGTPPEQGSGVDVAVRDDVQRPSQEVRSTTREDTTARRPDDALGPSRDGR